VASLDFWQLSASIAAAAFTLGNLDQLRMTYKTRNVDGLSLVQWIVFSAASATFAAYYIHLEQWMMVSMSLFGTICCFTLLGMILRYRQASAL